MNHFHSSLIERLESRKEMSKWIEVLLSFFEDIPTIDSAYGLKVCIQRYLYHSTIVIQRPQMLLCSNEHLEIFQFEISNITTF